MIELCAHDTAIAVWSGYFSPDDADFRTLTLAIGSVDVGDALSKVEPISREMG